MSCERHSRGWKGVHARQSGRLPHTAAVDISRLDAYTYIMTAEKSRPFDTPCLCNVLRRASRVATRIYEKEPRSVDLRITQYSLLSLLQHLGEVRQGDLGPLTVLDETSLTRALRPLS